MASPVVSKTSEAHPHFPSRAAPIGASERRPGVTFLYFDANANRQRLCGLSGLTLKAPMIIAHKNIEAWLTRLEHDPYLQPGPSRSIPKDYWFNRTVILEFPAGELFENHMKTLALVGLERPAALPLTGKEGFNAQGLEGKVQVKKPLLNALVNLRDLLPRYRDRIIMAKR